MGDGSGQPGTDGGVPDAAITGTGGGVVGTGGILGTGAAVPGTGGIQGNGGVTSSGGIPELDAGGLASGGVTGTGGITGTGGSTVSCGEPGFQCCAGNACTNGGCCVSGICMGQGGTCVGMGGGICNAGACGACGAPGLACCGADPVSGSCTAPNTRCNAGTCATCGNLGSACCAGPSGSKTGVCNAPNSICNDSGLCISCGSPGTACCPGSLCTSPGCCYENMCVGENTGCGTSAGTCQAGRCSGCGTANQPCCSNSTCYDGLLCKGGTCTPCGDSGQACCPASSAAAQCKSGMACTSTGAEGVCARCGGLGDICCAGNACADGCCSGGRCLATDSCSQDAGTPTDAPIGQCATGGVPCSGLARFAGVQVMDGKDDEFCNIPSFELSFANAGKTLENNTTGKSYAERAVARVAWDDAGIHAFVHVYDSTFVAASSSQLWNGDGVELMFSSSTTVTGLTSTDANTLHVITSPKLAQSSKDTATTGTQTALPAGQFLTDIETGGYFVELNLPWPGTPPTAGSQIKFDMQLNIADGSTSSSDLYTRDAQAILYLGAASSSTTSCASTIQPFCDDRLWCTTTLQP